MAVVKTSVSVTEGTIKKLKDVNDALILGDRKILSLSEATRVGVHMLSKTPKSEICEVVRALRVEDSNL